MRQRSNDHQKPQAPTSHPRSGGRRRELTDTQLLEDAWRQLRRTPRVFTGTASSTRSRAFSAKRRGLCGRCGRWINRGDDIRYVKGFEGPVHCGCRAPDVTVAMVEKTTTTTGTRTPGVCPDCHLEHAGECW